MILTVYVEPYDTDLGVFWSVVNDITDEVIDDGFDSTADAEMWCYDNGYIQDTYTKNIIS